MYPKTRREDLCRKRIIKYLPAVAVLCSDIGSDANQEIHYIVMASADGIVKGSDAFIVGLAGVAHLWKTFCIEWIHQLNCYSLRYKKLLIHKV